MSGDRRLHGGEANDTPPQDTRLVRALKVAVAGMGLLIVAGLAAVIWRIVDLASSPKVPAATISAAGPAELPSAALPSAVPPEIELALPDGASVRTVSLNGQHLAVHYEAPEGPGIAILDLATGRTVSRVRIGTGVP